MKPSLKLSIPFIVMLLICSTSFAFVNISIPHKVPDHPAAVKPSPFAGMTIEDFINLTPRRYKELTGRRLSLSQKFSLKIAQRKVRKMVKQNKSIDLMRFARDIDTQEFNIAGFILGIALGPLGILIAYLIEGKGSSMFRWSLLGALIWLGLFLLVVVIL